MAERPNPNTARDNTIRSRAEENRPRSLSSSRNINDDDVIASLANARENRRARQVNEWEHLGVKSMFRVV
jgi:hypothetical protein